MSIISVATEQIAQFENDHTVARNKTLDIRINNHEMDLVFVDNIGDKFNHEIILTVDKKDCFAIFQELEVGASMPFSVLVRTPFTSITIEFDTEHISFKNYDFMFGYIEVDANFYDELKHKLKQHGHFKPSLNVVKSDDGVTISTKSSAINLSLEDIPDLIQRLNRL